MTLPGRSRASIFAFLLVAVSFAGCSGGASPKGEPSNSPTVLPTHDAETGAIEGLVTDEELAPIIGARIGLAREGLETASTANGSFAFAALAPGTYQMFVEALGYQSAARKVEVVAGAVSRANVALQAIEVVGEAYLLAIPRVLQLNLDGPWSIDTTEGPYVNVSQYQDLRCSPCYAIVHYASGEQGVHTELRWTGTYVSPVTNTVILRYVRNWTTESGPSTSTGTLVYRPVLPNQGSVIWPDANVKEARKSGGMMKFFVTIPRDSIAIGMKVETWTTFAYNGPIPEDYTAFPPS